MEKGRLTMNTVVERFIELSVLERRRRLTKEERREKEESLKYLDKWLWEWINLKTMSVLAWETNDKEWLHEICERIDELNV